MKNFLTLSFLTLISILTPAFSHAEGSSIFKTEIKGDITSLLKGDKRVLRLNFRTAQGRHAVELEKIDSDRFYDDNESPQNDLILFQGTVKTRNGDELKIGGASAHILGNKLYINLHTRRRAWGTSIVASLPSSLEARSIKSASIHYALNNQTSLCAAFAAPSTQKVTKQELNSMRATANRELTISLDVDYDFHRSISSQYRTTSRAIKHSKDSIRSILNTAEAIYISQLGIRFKVREIKVDSSRSRPYSSNDADQLLQQFRNFTISNRNLKAADVTHLFTGRSIVDGVIGLAFVGTTCRNDLGKYSYGLTKKSSASVQALITAHEIAHNLGAQHVDEPGSIMSTFLSADKNRFVSQSLSQISSFINQYGSCL